MLTIREIARTRKEKIGGEKYTLPTGENMAMYRNLIVDLIEELADAHNAVDFLEEKLAKINANTDGGILNKEMIVKELDILRQSFGITLEFILALGYIMPSEVLHDTPELSGDPERLHTVTAREGWPALIVEETE